MEGATSSPQQRDMQESNSGHHMNKPTWWIDYIIAGAGVNGDEGLRR